MEIYQILNYGTKRYSPIPAAIFKVIRRLPQINLLLRWNKSNNNKRGRVNRMFLSRLIIIKSYLMKIQTIRKIVTTTAFKKSFKNFYIHSQKIYKSSKLTPIIWMTRQPKSAKFQKCMSREKRLSLMNHQTSILLSNLL